MPGVLARQLRSNEPQGRPLRPNVPSRGPATGLWLVLLIIQTWDNSISHGGTDDDGAAQHKTRDNIAAARSPP